MGLSLDILDSKDGTFINLTLGKLTLKDMAPPALLSEDFLVLSAEVEFIHCLSLSDTASSVRASMLLLLLLMSPGTSSSVIPKLSAL